MFSPGDKIGKINVLIESFLKKNFNEITVMSEYGGNYINSRLHDGAIPHKGKIDNNRELRINESLCIEPIFILKKDHKNVSCDND